jgi:hypothetical protein
VDLIRIDSLDDERLAFFTQLTDVELRRTLEPDSGLYIAESSKVIERAVLAGQYGDYGPAPGRSSSSPHRRRARTRA